MNGIEGSTENTPENACISSAFCVQFIREKRAIFHIVCTFWAQKNAAVKKLLRHFGDSAAIRTQDPRLRRALLYPAELRNQP